MNPIKKELKKILEPKKNYLDKNLWIIRNFLTQEELDFIQKEANDSNGWHSTMRSPYSGNIKNKFLGYMPVFDDSNNLILPKFEEVEDIAFFDSPYGINDRLEAVLPENLVRSKTLQSFFYVSDDEIISSKYPQAVEEDWAMDWHFEQKFFNPNTENLEKTNLLTASYNIYINDDFGGGELVFKYKNIKIKPEPGMLINIPLTEEYTHKVSKITYGNRHTIYGNCFSDISKIKRSTNEDC